MQSLSSQGEPLDLQLMTWQLNFVANLKKLAKFGATRTVHNSRERITTLFCKKLTDSNLNHTNKMIKKIFKLADSSIPLVIHASDGTGEPHWFYIQKNKLIDVKSSTFNDEDKTLSTLYRYNNPKPITLIIEYEAT